MFNLIVLRYWFWMRLIVCWIWVFGLICSGWLSICLSNGSCCFFCFFLWWCFCELRSYWGVCFIVLFVFWFYWICLWLIGLSRVWYLLKEVVSKNCFVRFLMLVMWIRFWCLLRLNVGLIDLLRSWFVKELMWW